MKEILKEFIENILNEAKPSKAAAQAKQMGLVSMGFGRWGKDGTITHNTDKGQLVPVQTTEPSSKQKAAKSPAQPIKTKKPATATPQVKKAVSKSAVKQPTNPLHTPTFIQKSMAQLQGGEGVLNAVKGVVEKGSAGAGTPDSRAAEASVVLVINHLLSLRSESNLDIDQFLEQNNEVINSIVQELSSVQGSKLKTDWHNSVKKQVVTAFSQVEKKFGKINKIVWDNEEGRSTVGITKKNDRDRSDMYVVLEDGRVIGVSLKKDGNVFLANQGYAKTIDGISALTTSPVAKEKLQELKSLHKDMSREKTHEMFKYTIQNHEAISQDLSKLTRDQISDVTGKEYDFLFDKNGKVSQEFIDKFNNASQKFINGEIEDVGQVFTSKQGFGQKTFKLLIKSLSTVAQNPELSSNSGELNKLLSDRRNVSRQVTHKLIKTIKTDDDVRTAVTGYMLDVLDIPQMLFDNPFEGVSHTVTVYGDGTVDQEGNNVPMFVDKEMLRKTLGIKEDASRKEVIKTLKERFIIDAEADSRAGMIRLKMTNPSPPPKYFYPTIATLEVRERGLETAAVFELHQHDAWTATLMNSNPNPESWSVAQRKKNAKETIKFLSSRLNDPIATDEERAEIETDLDFYNKLLLGAKK